jgi:hypothetical protein
MSAVLSLVVRFLHEQLAPLFSILDSPVWMDSSTTSYCRQIEVFVEVLLQNVGFCNGCITERCLDNSRKVS